ncbi:MAG: hypothetical protein OWS74_00465 [Firmicutes bacterium]|nr:hypothetical protein [Bacillota bacterium]
MQRVKTRIKIGVLAAVLIIFGMILWWYTRPIWINLPQGELDIVNTDFNAYFIVSRIAVPSREIGRCYRTLGPNHAVMYWSNRLPAGIKVYTIRKKNPDNRLAVEIHPHDYVLATYYGTTQP